MLGNLNFSTGIGIHRLPSRWLLLGAAFGLGSLAGSLPGSDPAPGAPVAPEAPWGDPWEASQPFLGMVVDLRGAELSDEQNLVPRGLVLRLEHGLYACFDTDLLRFAALWRAEEGELLGVTPVSMSVGSYYDPVVKAPPGQANLPKPVGEMLLANAVHPGTASGGRIGSVFEDPREPVPNPDEIGRGGLPREWARWRGVTLEEGRVRLVYDVGDVRGTGAVEVRESVEAVKTGGALGWVRRLEVGQREEPLVLALAKGLREDWDLRFAVAGAEAAGDAEDGSAPALASLTTEEGVRFLRLDPGPPLELLVVHGPAASLGPLADTALAAAPSPALAAPRWPETVELAPQLGDAGAAVTMDTLGVPLENPWRRNVRVVAVDFLSDGRAAAATYDGDVWIVEGWDGREPDRPARWRRFAAGLHEPLNLATHRDSIYVADRNGIQRLVDRSGDGEADWYECVGNQHGQTAETREFATGLAIGDDGFFHLSKGGISSHSLGRHNGTVLRVSPDGAEVERLGWGLRMPFLGLHPTRGWTTASDQQGNWVPATPLHFIREGRYYGFLHGYRGDQPYEAELEPPAVWLPHAFNQSGASQVWAPEESMGALSGRLVHLGYEKSAVYVAGLEERSDGGMRGLVSQIPVRPTAALLSASAAPHDGHLYLAGMRIWDSSGAPDLSNVFRLRPGQGEASFAVGGAAGEHGVRLDFADPLDREAAQQPGNYAAERWNYRRSAAYGSGHFRLDGEPGTEPLAVVAALLSEDGRSVFLALGDMRPSDQLSVTYTLRSARGASVAATSYLTVHDPLEPVVEAADGSKSGSKSGSGRGFESAALEAALARAAAAPPLAAAAMEDDATAPAVSAEEGERLSVMLGCIACHSTDGSTEGRSGPSWLGVYGASRPLHEGGEALADEAYLRESIYEPAALVVAGYGDGEAGMPSYAGILSEAQVASIIEFIKSLGESGGR